MYVLVWYKATMQVSSEVIDLASEGAMESEGGEEENQDDVCAQHV